VTQSLCLKGKGLSNLNFLIKFLRENPYIEDIDIGDNPLTDEELGKFNQQILEQQTTIQKLEMAGIKGIKSGTRSLIQSELTKNMNISKHLKE